MGKHMGPQETLRKNLVLWLSVISFCLLQRIQAQETFSGQFNTASYANNDGSQSFLGNWTETNDDGSATGGRIEIVGNQLEFNNLDNRSIARSLDLSAYSGAILSLDYNRTSGDESLLVQLFDGSTYNTVATLAGTGSVSYTLSTGELSASSSIQFITGSGNWAGGETIYVDNVTFTEIPDQPPVLTITGNQIYCPGTSLSIVETISLTDPDNTTTDAIYIQVSSGYVNGEDLLTLTGSHPAITASWDAVEGELTLQGPATFTEFEAAILDVEYSSSAANPLGTRQFSITPGTANYLPPTDHYYEFVADPGISWTDARDAAAARTYFGLQGYLATLVTQEEADFSGSQAQGVGWIGASDAATEGDWQWVTGPEAGTSFWSGGIAGTTVAPFNFAYWNGDEPNNSGNEDYAHITDPSVVRGTGGPGSWNDLPNAGGGGAYAPQGYVVEYGGSVGDPVLSLTGVTTITMDNIAPTASSPPPISVFCATDVPAANTNSITDEADNCTANPAVTFISDVSDGGTNPEIVTRTYRVTDDSGNIMDVTQTITITPLTINSQPSDQTVGLGANANFTVNSSNADTFQWQVSTNGGTSFSNISDGSEYSGTTTQTLTILSVDSGKDGYLYQFVISNSASSCPSLTSSAARLTTEMDSDQDGISDVVDLDDDNDGILDSVECPNAFTVLWVTDGTASTEEQNTIDKLTALGFVVTVVDDGVGGNADNYAVTFIYEDAVSGTAFTNVSNLVTTERGVITSETFLHDEILGANQGATNNTNFVNITNNSHPITNGLSLGNNDIGDASFRASSLVSGTVLGLHPNGEVALAVWEVGDAMDVGTAPGRRAIVPHANSNGGFNAAGEDLLVSAIIWTAQKDTDLDGMQDCIDTDSDGDGCGDADEAYADASTDSDDNGRFGSGFPAINGDGTVAGASYMAPADQNGNGTPDYLEVLPAVSISGQPINVQTCPGCNTSFTVTASNADTFQWQRFTGSIWEDLSDGGIYGGTSTNSLSISNPTSAVNGEQYRVLVSNSAQACSMLISNQVTLGIAVGTIITNRRITFRINKN